MRKRLTQTVIDHLRPDPDRTYDIHDTQQSGLVVRVRPSGVHSYLVRLKDPDTRAWYWYTLASTKDLSPEAARVAASAARGQTAKARLGAGNDPRAELRHRHRQAEEAKRRSTTLREFLKDTYEPWAKVNRKTGLQTVARIRSRFKELLDTPLAGLGAFTMERWRTARRKAGRSASTINRDIAALKGCLRHGVRSRAITVNPLTAASDFTPLKVDRFGGKLRVLDAAEEKRLRAALLARDGERREARTRANQFRADRGYELYLEYGTYTDVLTPLVVIALQTGCRFGELCELTWGDVDLAHCMLHVRPETSKAGKGRSVPMNKEATEVLRDWRPRQPKPDAYVFPGRDGKRLVDIKTAWGEVVKTARLVGFRFHDLRHTFASRLVATGADLNIVRELLGHATLLMTSRYLHSSSSAKREAVGRLATPIGARF